MKKKIGIASLRPMLWTAYLLLKMMGAEIIKKSAPWEFYEFFLKNIWPFWSMPIEKAENRIMTLMCPCLSLRFIALRTAFMGLRFDLLEISL